MNEKVDQSTLENMAAIEVEADEIERIEEGETEEEGNDSIYSAILITGIIKTVLGITCPNIRITKKIEDDAIKKIAPVLSKYGANMPAWLDRYAEEIDLLMFLAITGATLRASVNATKQGVNEDTRQRNGNINTEQNKE